MPKFVLNKIVRDKLVADYERLGQKAEYKKLSQQEHKCELIRKIFEEVGEINPDDATDKIAGEIADLQQVIKDFMSLCSVNDEQVEAFRQAKFDKKGGFVDGAYVTTITLSDDDEWVKYYRERPNIFPEIK